LHFHGADIFAEQGNVCVGYAWCDDPLDDNLLTLGSLVRLCASGSDATEGGCYKHAGKECAGQSRRSCCVGVHGLSPW
jgi:hypothetical protein